ncbi:hypothetical protein [Streptomyces sp. WAC00263]|uniref:hypothetical protein n=1 Tax=Streptomyces sp. WAC00263 TaxID=1917422 RepID=UPI0015EF08A4|nr:hypothetical protein [Streptomyces sp. WAC00263]KAF5991433.1 hypothetical protein BOG92_005585 [Streptomyces sp. WAC00263]
MHERPLSVQVGSEGFGPLLKVVARSAGGRAAAAISGDIDTEHQLQRSLPCAKPLRGRSADRRRP